MSRLAERVLRFVVVLIAYPVLWVVSRRRSRCRTHFWGPAPVLNIKYWSAAMSEGGAASQTLVREVYVPINCREDFDLVFDDLVPSWVRVAAFRRALAPYFAMAHLLRECSVMHMPFTGGPLADTRLWAKEALLFKRAGVKTVILPYGSDVYLYSRIADPAFRHVLLSINPPLGRFERDLEERVYYWSKHADVIVMSFTVDGVPRWDVLVTNMIAIDTREWQNRVSDRQGHDGRTGVVNVFHSANHRVGKGTEFIEAAVRQLQREGLRVELQIAERLPNATVRAMVDRADIHADQLISPGYGLAAIESMAMGLPVIANLDPEYATRVFRRYSYLDECPIVSATPERILSVLRRLVTTPQLRIELGTAGRAYVEKYHSFAAAQYLFGAIHRRVVDGDDVDLMNLYNPRTSARVVGLPKVEHPLRENRLPPS